MKILRLLFACVVVATLLPILTSGSQDAKPTHDTTDKSSTTSDTASTAHSEDEMQLKLEYSKVILDGLVTEDFAKVLKGAKSLNEFGKRKWQENESAAYRTQNQVFWFTTGALIYAAEDENIDGATLAYTQMTHSCINCHKLIRTR